MNWWKVRKYNLRYWPSIKTAAIVPPRYHHKFVEKLLQSSQLHTKGHVWTHEVVHTFPKSYLGKVKQSSHYFFGDERNSDRVSQAPPDQIGLVKLQSSCHNHERYKHWQKRLNQYRHKVLSWCLHRLGPIKKSHLFHYELGIHAPVKSSTIFLWPHVLVLG